MKIYIFLFFVLLRLAHATQCDIYFLKTGQLDNIPNNYNNLVHQYNSKSYPLLDMGPQESRSFKRLPTVLEGNFHPQLEDLLPNQTSVMLKLSGKASIYDGQEYFEFPNSTALKFNEREFIFTRGVRAYETRINLLDGSISPQGYVSDVLLFEIINGEASFVKTIMKSSPEKNFLFEDPRISVLYEKNGSMKIFLSGTDYSPHVKGSNNPDVMNRYVELKIDSQGTPLAVTVNKETKRPKFLDLSPKPFKSSDGDMIYLDAKNATISQNEAGQIVVRTRLRPDFENPYFIEVTKGKTWKYAEQVFVFDKYADLEKYDWKYAIEDLFDKDLKAAANGRLKPKVAKTIITDKDLPEMYKSTKVMESKGKGLGPGTIPVRVRRAGNKLYVSDAVNAPEYMAGTIPANMLSSFPVKSGEVKFVTFDHEIRYFEDTRGGSKFVKRHYTASIKLFDDSLTKIDGYYSDVIQPKTLHEIGDNAGIADLQHVYPMGRTLNTENGVTGVTVYGGASDAHTTAYKFNLVTLLTEMGTNSPRRATGQVR